MIGKVVQLVIHTKLLNIWSNFVESGYLFQAQYAQEKYFNARFLYFQLLPFARMLQTGWDLIFASRDTFFYN